MFLFFCFFIVFASRCSSLLSFFLSKRQHLGEFVYISSDWFQCRRNGKHPSCQQSTQRSPSIDVQLHLSTRMIFDFIYPSRISLFSNRICFLVATWTIRAVARSQPFDHKFFLSSRGSISSDLRRDAERCSFDAYKTTTDEQDDLSVSKMSVKRSSDVGLSPSPIERAGRFRRGLSIETARTISKDDFLDSLDEKTLMEKIRLFE